MRRLRGLIVPLLLLGLAAPLWADDARGRHKRVFIVPVPAGKEVKIDADLSDWDLSGQITTFVAAETEATQSARFALMCDKDALYISGVVADPSPMMNRHSPDVDPDWSWDADACQFRIVLDAAQGWPVSQGLDKPPANNEMCHMTMWYYTDKNQPNIVLEKGMGYVKPAGYTKGVVPQDKFQAAYKKRDDGMGYTFEYRVPWSTLQIKAVPKPGDLVAATVQFNWSRPDGLRTAGGNAWAYDVMGTNGFPFQSSTCWGKAIFSKKGNLPREMVEEGVPPERPLPLAFEYDVPEESEVTVTLFDPAGQMVRNLVASGSRHPGKNVEKWDGLDDAGHPLKAGPYTWKGLSHGPITTKWLLSVHNSGQPPYKTDDGSGGWGGDHGWPQCVAAAGDKIYITWNAAEAGWGLIRTNLDGKKEWGSVQNAELVTVSDDGTRVYTACTEGLQDQHLIRVVDAKDFRPMNFGRGSPVAEAPKGATEPRSFRGFVTGLDCAGDTLYGSFPSINQIVLYDANQGTVKTTWNVPNPGPLVARPDGTVLVVSGNQVLNIKDGKPSPLITDHLDTPAGIALDAAGNVYVSNRGKLQNVSVFGAEGKYQKSIGKEGGRPRKGTYDPSGMLEPKNIAVDKNGHLWVPEEIDYPKRTSVWDTKTGQLVNEFFGGSCYATWVYMDPNREDRAYCHDVEWEVNLDKATSKPLTTLWRADPDNPNMVGPIGETGNSGHLRVITAKNGKHFAFGQGRDYGARIMIRDGDVFKPFMATIPNLYDNPYIPWPLYPALANKEKFKQGQYLWQDANNDQCVQENELTLMEEWTAYLQWFDFDCTIWNMKGSGGFFYKPVKFGDDGRPIYDLSKSEPNPFFGRVGNMTSAWTNLEDPSDTSVYTLRVEMGGPGKTNDPLELPGFTRFSRDGKPLWNNATVVNWRDAMNMGVSKPGKLWGPTVPLGVAGDFTGVATYFGPVHILTRDGLYVAKIMKDGRLPGMGADVIAAEGFSGQMIHTKSGKYLFLAGDQDGRITQILGLDTVKPLAGGKFTLAQEQVDTAKKAIDDYNRSLVKLQSLAIARGNRQSLGSGSSVGKRLEDGRSFSARLAYDQDNLYVQYEVESPSPLLNATPDPHLVFKGGNVIDLQIASDSKAPADRDKPAPGDLRLLITRQGDKPLAVLYRPKVAGFNGAPTVLESPSGKEPFDEIKTLDNVKLDYAPSPGGFTAIATIPLADLGWKPAPGTTAKIDVGYLFGNATGTQTATRAYWTNNSFTANVVNDVPHESRLEPKEWGTATIE